jgi:hypothetical protein
MSLDKTKVLNGPVTMVCYGLDETEAEEEKLRIEGLKKDSLTLNSEDEVDSLEDRIDDLIGRNGTGEIVFSEVDNTDLALINDDLTKVEFEFPGKAKKVTFTKPATTSEGLGWMVRPKVEGGKTKITVKKFVIGDNWPFVIGAIA